MLKLQALAAFAFGILLTVGAHAQSDAGMQTGVLNCNVASGWGFIFGSSRDLRCSFQPARGPIEHYYGHISRFGVDIGFTRAGVLVWAVLAPATTLAPGSLAGRYAGGTASATVGAGVGVNALIGGFNRSITLQPVSIQGNTGLNVAAGIGAMELRFDRSSATP